MDQKPIPGNERVRAHVWVRGRVQGVGFRAHVEYSARQIGGVTGWVRNVGYDTVEAVVEGDRPAVERLIEAIRQGPRGARVEEETVEWEAPTAEFSAFETKRSR